MLKRNKKLWKTVDDFEVYLVDGPTVRKDKDIDFNWGGHHQRYNYIPESEIWIENYGSEQEKDFVLLHELHEWKLMDDGMEYEKAHKASNVVELKARKHPGMLKKLLEIETSEDD